MRVPTCVADADPDVGLCLSGDEDRCEMRSGPAGDWYDDHVPGADLHRSQGEFR